MPGNVCVFSWIANRLYIMTTALPKTKFARNKSNLLVLDIGHVLSIHLRDYLGAVSADISYEMLVGDELVSGKSEGGYITQSVDDSVESVRLTVWPYKEYPNIKKRWRIKIDSLEPSDSDEGKVKRLNNLGYFIPDGNTVQDSIAVEAESRFKKDYQLTSDDALLSALTAVDGGSVV